MECIRDLFCANHWYVVQVPTTQTERQAWKKVLSAALESLPSQRTRTQSRYSEWILPTVISAAVQMFC